MKVRTISFLEDRKGKPLLQIRVKGGSKWHNYQLTREQLESLAAQVIALDVRL